METTATREHPILFRPELVRKILDGKKTQTRRPVKPQPSVTDGDGAHWRDSKADLWRNESQYVRDCCPFGQVGDVLWVRENFRITEDIDGREVVEYQAGGTRLKVGDSIEHGEHRCTSIAPRWTPSIHMPRWACRLRLPITEIRAERVQSIGEEDCYAEGIEIPVSQDGRVLIRLTGKCPPCQYHRPISIPKGETLTDSEIARCHFASAWETAYTDSWTRNDLVWVITFKKLESR